MTPIAPINSRLLRGPRALSMPAGGFVLVAEAFNTAIEIDMNFTSPEAHPYARDAKDVSAGAVLISAFTTVIIGLLIFGCYLFRF